MPVCQKRIAGYMACTWRTGGFSAYDGQNQSEEKLWEFGKNL